MDDIQNITVIGNGGWGNAIAVLLAKKNRSVTIWGHDVVYLAECARTHENKRYLPGIRIPDNVEFEADKAKSLARAELVVQAVPTRHLRGVLTGINKLLDPEVPVVTLTKGIDTKTLKFPSEITSELTGSKHVVVLSGPSISEEVAQGLPASVTVAHHDIETAKAVQRLFSTEYFRVYANEDMVGVELGGAVKNVIAIAAGACDGMKLGDNAKAALLARGLAELSRLGRAMGARDDTFSGLSGVGDLYTTCASPWGRNRGYGERLGRGMTPDAAIAATGGMIVEGHDAALAIHKLAQRHSVDMPICRAVYRIIYEQVNPRDAVRELLTRGLRVEHGSRPKIASYK